MRTLWPVLLLAFQAAPEEEYKAKLAQISKTCASKHYSIGEYLSSAQMHLWAREQYNKVVEFDPDHEGARRKLGYKKGDSGWENDPSAKVEGNKKKDADADKVRKLYTEKLDLAGKDISRLWSDLALWCKKNSLPKEAVDAFRKAIEYDPMNAGARKELGYEKDPKGFWISKVERDLRKEMKDGISKAPSGAASAETTSIETALGLKHARRESVHFLMESPHLKDAELANLIQHAEHAFAMYHKIMGEDDLFSGRKMDHVILKDKAQHLRFVDAFHKGSPAQKELARKSGGSIGFPVSEEYQDTAPMQVLEDWTVHSTVQILSEIFIGGSYLWIHEGTAYHFTRLMKDSAMTYCVDLAGTSPGAADVKDLRDPANWPVIVKVWVREGKDSNIDKVLKCTSLADFTGPDCIKAWSLIEFLLAEHREKYLAFCRSLKGGANLEEGLKGIWGWTTTDLDQRWKHYVRTTY
jgi:tetratricopeptide (TPR) repeat protein